MPKFSNIKEAIEDIKNGKMVIVIDDEDRENEGDLLMSAEKITPEAVNFMATHGKGLICVPMTGERLDHLQIPLMVTHNTEHFQTAFCVSVEAKYKVHTGISARDRYETIKALIDPATKPEDMARPGHTFPLRARVGGVLERVGHTEAAVDIVTLAGLYPAGVICEILNEDGSMARVPELIKFAEKFNLKIITIAGLIKYRVKREKLVKREATAKLPTPYGEFTIVAYSTKVDNKEHIALVKGEITEDEPVTVRVHSECLTGDVFNSKRCDCGAQLKTAMQIVSKKGKGVILYMRQEGRGIGLINKMRAYELQDQGKDTVQANEELGFRDDLRDYGLGAQILVDLGVRKMELLTNNPRKVVGLEGYGLEIVRRVPLLVAPNEINIHYLKTKRDKMGHHIDLDEIENLK